MIDFSKISELYIDSKKVTSLSLDGHEVPFGQKTPKYFTVTALDQPTDIAITVGIGSPPAFSLEYSTDGDMWSSYSAAQTITLAAGKSVMFRRVGEATTTFSSDSSNYWRFGSSAPLKVSGNIMSLLDASMQSTTVGRYCFYQLFRQNTYVADASELVLPATTLATNCYGYMFAGCTSLTAAPALPATTLAVSCYQYMFQGCTSLTSAPALPATTLAGLCYFSMFDRCTSLSAAPALPATKVADSCYGYMFQGCTSLSSAPELPAITLVNGCYSYMFRNCSSLSSMDVKFTAWKNISNWLNNVAATGTFICPTALGTNETIERGTSRCPTGWMVVNYDAT